MSVWAGLSGGDCVPYDYSKSRCLTCRKRLEHSIIQKRASDPIEVYDKLTFVLERVNEFDGTDSLLTSLGGKYTLGLF